MDFELYFILPITVPERAAKAQFGSELANSGGDVERGGRELRGRRCQSEAVRYSQQEMALWSKAVEYSRA